MFDYSNFSVYNVCAQAERKRMSNRKSKKKFNNSIRTEFTIDGHPGATWKQGKQT